MSLLNQAILSGAGFILNVYLLRKMDPTQYGIYSIGFSALLLLTGVANSLLAVQLVVQWPSQTDVQRAEFLSALLSPLLYIGAITFAFLLLGFGFRSVRSVSIVLVGLTTILGGVASSARDLLFRHLYSARRESVVFIMNVMGVAGLCAGLAVIQLTHASPNAWQGLLVYATAQASVAASGFVQLGPQPRLSSHVKWKMVQESSRGALWALLGMLITWTQSQAYVYVSAVVAGPVAVATANAARLAIAPFQMLFPAVNNVVLPKLAADNAKSRNAAVKMTMKVAIGMFAAAVLYGGIMTITAGTTAALLLGERYAAASPLVLCWCVYLVCQVVRDDGSMLLQVNKRFRSLALYGGIAALACLFCTMTLGRMMGSSGVIWGGVVGEIFLISLIWREVVAIGRQR